MNDPQRPAILNRLEELFRQGKLKPEHDPELVRELGNYRKPDKPEQDKQK